MNSLLVVTRPELLIIHVIWNLRAGGEVFIFAGGGGGGLFLGGFGGKLCHLSQLAGQLFPLRG